jgi:uncharacterized protein involved in exopolysaccharide biosynthesis
MISQLVPNYPLQRVVQILFRHKKKAIGLFLATTVLATILTLLMPRVYQSQAKLMLRLGRENVGLDAMTSLGQSAIVTVPQTHEHEINSIVEVLRNRSLVEQVVDTIGPDRILGQHQSDVDSVDAQSTTQASSGLLSSLGISTPISRHDRAVNLLAEKISVEPARKSNILLVSCTASDPQLAQTIVATLIDFYLKQHIQMHRAPGALEFLSSQTAKAREQLISAEDELRELQNRTGLISPETQCEGLIRQIEELENELVDTDASLKAAVAETALLRHSLTDLSSLQVTGRNALNLNFEGENVRQQLYSLQIHEQQLLSRYTESYFEVIQLRQQIDALKHILSQSQNLAPTQLSADSDERFTADQMALIQSEPSLAALHARSQEHLGQIESMRQRLIKWNMAALQITKLERDIQIREAAYQEYATNMEKARIDHALQAQRITNINVVQPATCEVLPISPNTRLNLAFGLCAALLSATGIALLAEQVSPLGKDFQTDQNQMVPPARSIQDRPAEQQRRVSLRGNYSSPLPYPVRPADVSPTHP